MLSEKKKNEDNFVDPPNDGDLSSDITIDKVDRAARNAKMVKLLDLDNVPNKV